MAGWLTATGRTLGIVTCSAMLLISATLGQTGQVSPPRSIAPFAVEVSGGDIVEDQRTETAESDAANQPATTSSTPDDVVSNDTQSASQAPEGVSDAADVVASGESAAQAGSGIAVPDDAFRFTKAAPVRMAPILLQIPDAWVDARIQTVGVTLDGEMEAPDDFWEVGWYRYGARPGDPGKAVIAGHLDSDEGAAVFFHIDDLEPGDEIRILLGGPDGERVYIVRDIAHYPADEAPVEEIFGPSDHSELVLITCGGDWQGTDAGGYTDRIVVYADMVTPEEIASPDAPRT